MKDYFKILLIVVVVGGAQSSFADTNTWNLDVPGEYVLSDGAQVEVKKSVGRLTRTITPSFLGNYNTTGSAEDAVVSSDGNTLYIADQTNGLQIVDISDPAFPIFLGEYKTINSDTQVVVLSADENTAYLAENNNGLVILDISDPTTPLLINNYTDYSANDIKISSDENTAYLASGFNGLVIVDISDPANPVYVNNYQTSPRNTYVVTISPDETKAYIYISGFGGGLYILDISDPMDITELGNYTFSNSQNFILSADENTLFSSGSAQGLFIFDVSDPVNPSLISQYDSIGFVANISISPNEDIAYLADGSEGITIVDIFDPTDPTLLVSFDSSGNARGVEISGDGTTAYLADSADGVDIIDLEISYPDDTPFITPVDAITFFANLTSFSHSLGANNEGTITYQVSTDDGDTWYYWDGSDWTETSAIDGNETSSVGEVNTNIATLDSDGGDFFWRAYLNSDGTEQVELDEVTIDGIFTLPPELEEDENRSSIRKSSRRLSQAQVDAIFGTTGSRSVDTIRELQIQLISLLTQLIAVLKG